MLKKLRLRTSELFGEVSNDYLEQKAPISKKQCRRNKCLWTAVTVIYCGKRGWGGVGYVRGDIPTSYGNYNWLQQPRSCMYIVALSAIVEQRKSRYQFWEENVTSL